jgi:hypothetical protein
MPILKSQLTDILIDEMEGYRIAINLLQVYKEESK